MFIISILLPTYEANLKLIKVCHNCQRYVATNKHANVIMKWICIIAVWITYLPTNFLCQVHTNAETDYRHNSFHSYVTQLPLFFKSKTIAGFSKTANEMWLDFTSNPFCFFWMQLLRGCYDVVSSKTNFNTFIERSNYQCQIVIR